MSNTAFVSIGDLRRGKPVMSDAIDTVDVAAWGFTAVGEWQVSA